MILSQDPKPDAKQIEYNGTISLCVNAFDSIDDAAVGIPKVRNYDEKSAIEKLEKKGFTYDIAYMTSSVAEGYVIVCTPHEGSMAQLGSTVTLIVSVGNDDESDSSAYDTSEPLGKEYTGTHAVSELSGSFETDIHNMIKVPDLAGYTFDDIVSSQTAESPIILVQAAGEHYSDTFPAGVIMAQKPAPNTKTDEYSIIVVYVSSGKKP